MVSVGALGTKTFWGGEDSFFEPGGEQCRGCGSLLASKLVLRTIYETNKNAMVFGRTCGGGRSELQTGGRIGCDGSGMMGIQAGFDVRGVKDKNLVVVTGDGRTLEMGFGDFVASFDREQKLTWIVLDNQAYSSSGSHASPTTPFRVATRLLTAESGGKHVHERNVPMMMIFAKARYVATASSAYVRDLVVKVQEAMMTKPSYVHIVVPCQVSWRYSPDHGVQLSRLLVQTGLLPLWRYKEGVFRRTVRIPKEQRIPVAEFFKLQERYRHVSEADLKEVNAYIDRQTTLVESMEAAFTKPGATVSY